MTVIESIGRNINDAIEKGLAQLGKNLEDVKVDIIKHGGLFTKAKVRITVEEPEETPVEAQKPQRQYEPKPEQRRESKPEQRSEQKREPKPEQNPEQRREPKSEQKPEQKPEQKREPRSEQRSEQKREPKPEQRREQRSEQKPETKQFKREVRPEQKREIEPENSRGNEAEGAAQNDWQARHFEPITPELASKAEAFVSELLTKMGLEVEHETSIQDGELHIDLKTQNSTVIGYHGEVLDSIEYMTSYVVNKDSDKYYHVVVNCNNYREKRKESLVAHANKMAAKCLKVRHKIVLEPMNSNERKIIHSALADNEEIITRSEGQEPNRHVVILCKKR